MTSQCRQPRSILASTAIVVILAIFLASCSSGSSNNGAKSPIIFGVLAPFSGPYAIQGKNLLLGVNLALHIINGAGGINGRPVEVRTEDSLIDPVDAIPAMQKLIQVDQAVAIIGPYTSVAGAVLPLTQKAHIPDMVVGGATQFDNETDPYYWRVSPSDGEQGKAMAYYALSRGWKTGALVFEEQPAAQTMKAPITDAFTHHGGTIVSTVDIVPAQSSYRSEILRVFAKHPQVVFTQMTEQTAGVFFPETQQMGLLQTPWIGTNTTDTSDFFHAVGPAIASSVVYATQSATVGSVGIDVFLKAYQQFYHTNLVANDASYGYDAATDLALAIDYAHSTDGTAINNAIEQVSNPPGTHVGSYVTAVQQLNKHQKINFDGATCTLDFDSNHNVYGPFSVLKFKSDGSTSTITTIDPQTLTGY
jgi:branched-chain amino acid transport system substrate-binding protein